MLRVERDRCADLKARDKPGAGLYRTLPAPNLLQVKRFSCEFRLARGDVGFTV
jgi:hypothetical protein